MGQLIPLHQYNLSLKSRLFYKFDHWILSEFDHEVSFVFMVMIDNLIELDKKLLLYLNGLHTPWLDPFMLYISQTYIWIPLYLFLLFLILKNFRNESWCPLLGIFVTILLSDQITSGLMKPLFERLRPSREPLLEGMVHIVNGYRGGLYGFASSHAANTFGAALFSWLLLKGKHKWIVILFIWAAVVSYSRIYLGVHYPGDVLVGALIGILSAIAGFRLFQWLIKFMKDKNALSTKRE
jgi:undecaprenyl-diphosphatase